LRFNPDDKDIAVAYLDPSTGSMVISAIVGIFATIVLGIKKFWYKLLSLFRTTQKDIGNKRY
jgi:hypothetical protein